MRQGLAHEHDWIDVDATLARLAAAATSAGRVEGATSSAAREIRATAVWISRQRAGGELVIQELGAPR